MHNFIATLMSIFELLSEIASFKTRRYFFESLKKTDVRVGPLDTDVEKVPEELLNVLFTLFTCLGKDSKRSLVEVSGETYPVSDYQFPSMMWELAKARKVFISRDGVDRVGPYFEVEDGFGQPLSPRQVLRFFESYNANQLDGDKVAITSCPDTISWDPAVLCDFKGFVDESGDSFVSFNENGSIPLEVSQILGIESPFQSEELLYQYSSYDWRYLANGCCLSRNK